MVNGSRRGVSLIEVEVALVLLATGFLASLALVTRAGGLMRAAEAEEGAGRVAGEVLDSLTQHGAPLPGMLARGRYAVSWSESRDTMGVTLISLIIGYDDGSRLRADTFAARAAPWPRSVHHVP